VRSRPRLSATYAIKKLADVSTRIFFPISLVQVYPELARLEGEGLVVRSEDPHGQRARAAYELTGAGEDALVTWLRSDRIAPRGLETRAYCDCSSRTHCLKKPDRVCPSYA